MIEYYYIDLDGILCEETKPYAKCKPIIRNINKVNKLFDENKKIIIWTARRLRDKKLTIKWLKENNVKFDGIHLGKPKFTKYIDEREKLIGW